jgi:hypothetical protein
MNQTIDNEPINTNFTYGIIGFYITKPSDRWYRAGVREGDFLGTTSYTRDINSMDKVHKALSSPNGTELILIRNINGDHIRLAVILED